MIHSPLPDKSEVVARICEKLEAGDIGGAKAIARDEYRFESAESAGRKYSEHQMMALFTRDGFVDRYSGKRLILPGALRLLSKLLPEEFPFHANWKMSESHIMWWELCPTVDHVEPVARGGKDDESNWVTTSMLRNVPRPIGLSWSLVGLSCPRSSSASGTVSRTGSSRSWRRMVSGAILTFGDGSLPRFG